MEFDKLVHQQTRLQLFAYLYKHGAASFSELQERLDITEGNLSSHTQRMADADCLAIEKEFVDGTPRTTYRLTDRGRRKFEAHVDLLETLIDGL